MVRQGVFSEGRHWLDQALARDIALTVERSRALYIDSMLAELQGDFAAAAVLVEQVCELAEQLGGVPVRANAMLARGYLGCMGGDVPSAVPCFERALDTLGGEGDIRSQVEARLGLALASGLLGDTARATACHEEALGLLEPRGELWYRSYSLWNLGLAAWLQDDHQRAVDLLEQGLRVKRAIDDPFGTCWYLEVLAWIAASKHDLQRAATLLGATASLSQAMGTLTVPNPDLVGSHDECEQRTRRALGDAEFTAAFQRGMDLTLTDAIAYALNEKPSAEHSSASGEPTLTRRERQVADLIANGLTNKEIATQLVISQRTAEGHVEHILIKLGFNSRAQVAAWAGSRATDNRSAGST